MATIKVDQTICDFCNELDIQSLAEYKCSICNKDLCYNHYEGNIIISHNSMYCKEYSVIWNSINKTIRTPIVCIDCDLNNNEIYFVHLKEKEIHQKYLSQLNEILNKIHQEVEEVWENTLKFDK